MDTEIKTIDHNINLCPYKWQPILQQIRALVRENAPEATETIKYAMQAFVLNGNLVHSVWHKNHIRFYHALSAFNTFNDEIANYKSSQGAVQFPHDKPIPYDLMARMIQFRVTENLTKRKIKKQ